MPIFAYRCDACGFEQDVLQKRSDAPLTTCPSCAKESFAKQLTAPAFQLKGSGWYVTDFRDNGKKGASKGGDAEKAEPSKADPAPADVSSGASKTASTGGAEPAKTATAPAASSTPAASPGPSTAAAS